MVPSLVQSRPHPITCKLHTVRATVYAPCPLYNGTRATRVRFKNNFTCLVNCHLPGANAAVELLILCPLIVATQVKISSTHAGK